MKALLPLGLIVASNLVAATEADLEQQQRVLALAKSESVGLFNAQTTVPALINDHVLLGTAYNNDTKEFLNVQTVAGNTSTLLGNTRLTFGMVTDGSYDSMLSQLNGNVDVDVGFPVVRVNAGGHIAKEAAATEFSNSYTFFATSTPSKKTLEPFDENQGYTRTPVGNDLASNYQSELMSLAGNSFISEIEYNAQLFVNMKVEYLSEQHKSEIGGELGVSYGAGSLGINVNGKLNYIDEELKKSVRITVRAIQKGGDPTELLKIIPNNIISCSLDNWEPCFTLYEQAVNYAHSDFGSQLQDLTDYNVVRYTAESYKNSSLPVRELAPEDQDIRFATTVLTIDLEDRFKKAINHEHRARQVLSTYSSWMDDAQRERAEQVKDKAYNNAWIYNQFAAHCRDNPYGMSCTDAWDDYQATCGGANTLPCEATYSVSDLDIQAQSLTPFFKCENAREATSNFGVESEESSLGYRNLGLAPAFVDNDTPADGVLVWVNCSNALNTYGTAFEE